VKNSKTQERRERMWGTSMLELNEKPLRGIREKGAKAGEKLEKGT